MVILHHHSLRAYNSFGIESIARRFTEVKTLSDLESALNEPYPLRILGGGSNVLLTGDVDALVIHNALKGIELFGTKGDDVFVKAAGGELWHDLVLWCIERGYAGIENLSLIPGSVGAAPIQNIGAYGVELENLFYSLEAVELASGEIHNFGLEDCRFGYRDSIFKQELKGKYFINAVTLRLGKKPVFNTSYGDIQKILGDKPLSIKNISDAVIQIRSSKLPNPKEIGNAGSFFKNPVILKSQFQALLESYASLPSYASGDEDTVKIPAGWLIEQAGWKGRRIGEVGVHAQQALVLLNYGKGKGRDILNLAKEVQVAILEKFGINIEPEVNIW